MREETHSTAKQSMTPKKKAAHHVIMKEIQEQLSGLSNSDNRNDRLKSIKVNCGILEKMDIPQGVYDSLTGEIKNLVDATKAEIEAKTAASNTISDCLKVVQNR